MRHLMSAVLILLPFGLLLPRDLEAGETCRVSDTYIQDDGRRVSRSVEVRCQEDLVRELRESVESEEPAPEYSLTSGRATGTPTDEETATGRAVIELEESFRSKPLLAARLTDYEIGGPPHCRTADLVLSKLDLSPSGFTLELAAPEDCELHAFDAEWIALEVEDSAVLDRLPACFTGGLGEYEPADDQPGILTRVRRETP